MCKLSHEKEACYQLVSSTNQIYHLDLGNKLDWSMSLGELQDNITRFVIFYFLSQSSWSALQLMSCLLSHALNSPALQLDVYSYFMQFTGSLKTYLDIPKEAKYRQLKSDIICRYGSLIYFCMLYSYFNALGKYTRLFVQRFPGITGNNISGRQRMIFFYSKPGEILLTASAFHWPKSTKYGVIIYSPSSGFVILPSERSGSQEHRS